MFERRLYRAAFLPLLPAIIVAAFSLTDRSVALSSTLSPNLFDGAQAMIPLTAMATRFPDRRPGSADDNGAAAYVAGQFQQASNAAIGSAATAAPFTVRMRSTQVQTIDGKRTIETVIATRPENLSGQIVLLAHRDAAAPRSVAQLSGTAALIELADVLAGRLTNRTITLVSTSGGSGGDGGAIAFAEQTGGPVDAVIVLGDVAGQTVRTPLVIPWSDGVGSAPDLLVNTVDAALAGQLGSGPGQASAVSQFAHLALPFAVGEQGPLNAAGLPSVLVQASGERGPTNGDPVIAARLENFGRGVLTAVNALDADANSIGPPVAAIQLKTKTLPAWAVRLLAAVLLLPSLIVTVDALARARRRRANVAQALTSVLTCALPFYFCALLVVALGAAGMLTAAPVAPVAGPAVALGSGGVTAIALVALSFVLAWFARAAVLRTLARRRGNGEDPLPVVDLARSGATGVALMLTLNAAAVVVWSLDPFTALLLVPAVHLWLLIASSELRVPRVAAVALLLLALVPVVALVGLYAHQLGLSPPEVAWTALLLVAGGHIGLLSSAVWSVCLGCFVVAGLLALRARIFEDDDDPEVTVRGPLSYAGPGSLGGTASALRR